MSETPRDSDSQRIMEALAEFYRVNDYGEDGGASARWIKVKLKPLPLSFYIPNFNARRRALQLHDIHHLVTGYQTNLAGEAEIAAWEMGGSCTTYWAAWLLNFSAFCYGWICLPRRVFRAFVSGRCTRNLYHEGWRDGFLDETIGRMRRHLELDQMTPRARLSDVTFYLLWVMIAVVTKVGIVAIIGGLVVVVVASSEVVVCRSSPPPTVVDAKIRGLVFTGPGSPPLQESMFSSMAVVGGNFVALVPEATVYRQSLDVRYDFVGQWYGEKTDATLLGIRFARRANLKVMLKPHLAVSWDMTGWEAPEDVDFQDPASRAAYMKSMRAYIETQTDRSIGKGSWRGDFDVKVEEDWPRFATNYREFILVYARLAEEHAVELFCIGTEMKRTALRRPEYWRSLIRDVRGVYTGQLVYAANWDSYARIEFWDALDYIGIDAYFAVSNARTPTVEEIERSWKHHLTRIEALQKRFAKPVVFTEWGYEDEDFAGKEPWVMGRVNTTGGTPTPNVIAQANAYEGMFRTLWKEPWMRGVFIWRWSPRPGGGGPSYSPRDKKAATVMKHWFGQQ